MESSVFTVLAIEKRIMRDRTIKYYLENSVRLQQKGNIVDINKQLVASFHSPNTRLKQARAVRTLKRSLLRCPVT